MSLAAMALAHHSIAFPPRLFLLLELHLAQSIFFFFFAPTLINHLRRVLIFLLLHLWIWTHNQCELPSQLVIKEDFQKEITY